MDTTGFSQVGRYGTLSLLRRGAIAGSAPSQVTTPSHEQSQVVTSFGIDSASLTFGQAATCDVRLYYATVDQVHCKVVNEEGKAFLVVQGKSGVLVDGCWVYPHSSASSSSNNDSQEHQQSIIPLTNNSEFEIHGKRFRFTYPPKEVRKVLLATPVAQKNRALRLSMIQSAQVFSPRPSKDPRENLRILQSPIKASIFGVATDTSARSRSQSPNKPRAVSPLKFGIAADDEDSDDDMVDDEDEEARGRTGEEHIVLVHTNHPRVVEEERDLVILENVPMHLVLPSPSVYSAGTPTRSGPQRDMGAPGPMQQQEEIVQPPPQPPRTPRRKSLGGTALHRAVLIRSAQRAVWKAEKEREDEEEEMEVLGAVVDDERENEDEELDEDVDMKSVSEEDEKSSTDEDQEEEEEKLQQKSLWRKSIERIIPWPFVGKKSDDEHDAESDHEQEEEDEEANEMPAPLPVLPQQKTPNRKVLGSFMTPQLAQRPKKDIFPANNSGAAATSATAAGAGRYSLGGGEAQRVIVQQPWRVRDLVVPPLGANSLGTMALGSMDPPNTPGGVQAFPDVQTSAVKAQVSEEERREIQERRRSAARDFRENPFWKDGAPGMSPAKARQLSPTKPIPGVGVGLPSARSSMTGTPAKAGSTTIGMTPRRTAMASPTKGRSLGYSITEGEAEEGDALFLDSGSGSTQEKAMATPNERAAADDSDDNSLDTYGMLERMRETVENLKRRRSVLPTATPKALLIQELATPVAPVALGSVKKLDFTRITPAVPKSASDVPPFMAADGAVTEPQVSSLSAESNDSPMEEDEEMEETNAPIPFSLLRPGARSSLSQKRREPPTIEEEVHAVPLALPVANPDATEDEAEVLEEVEAKTRGRTRGKPRLLRAPKGREEPAQVEEEAEKSGTQTKPKSKPDSRIKPSSNSKPRSRSAKSPAPPLPAAPTATTLAPEPSGSGQRRQRSKTPQPSREVEPEVEVEQEQAPARPKRTRKGTAEPEEPTAAPKGKGKKAAEPEPETEAAEEEEKAAPAKRGRKPRAAAVVEDAEAEDTPAPAPAKRGRPKKAKEPEPVMQVTEDDNDDELDSYEVLPTVATSSKKPTKSQIQPPTKTRKKLAAGAAVKQETADEQAPLAAARTGRSGRANPGVAAAVAKTPAPSGAATKIKPPTSATNTGPGKSTTAAIKTRSRPKTPATAPTGATAAVAGAGAEKENALRTVSGSNNSSDDVQEPDVVVKVRVSRRAGATTPAVGSGKTTRSAPSKAVRSKPSVKVEQDDEGAEEVVPAGTGKTRTTRVMRTRVKTG